MKDESLDRINLRIEIVRKFFNLDKDYTIIHEIFIASDDLLMSFIAEYKTLSKELRFRVRMKQILIYSLYLVFFKITSRLPDSFFFHKRRSLVKIFKKESSHEKVISISEPK